MTWKREKYQAQEANPRRRRRLATLLFNVLPREERSSSPSCENTLPPLYVCVCLPIAQRAIILALDLTLDRSINFLPINR